MYHPDQHYEAHTLYLKDLYGQVEQRQRIAALTQHRHARGHVVGRRLGTLLVTVGTWLARSATSSRLSLRWRLSGKPAGWGRAVALPSSACGNTGGVCDPGGNQSSACHAAELCISCIPQ
jgi:hypothetical protein